MSLLLHLLLVLVSQHLSLAIHSQFDFLDRTFDLLDLMEHFKGLLVKGCYFYRASEQLAFASSGSLLPAVMHNLKFERILYLEVLPGVRRSKLLHEVALIHTTPNLPHHTQPICLDEWFCQGNFKIYFS